MHQSMRNWVNDLNSWLAEVRNTNKSEKRAYHKWPNLQPQFLIKTKMFTSKTLLTRISAGAKKVPQSSKYFAKKLN